MKKNDLIANDVDQNKRAAASTFSSNKNQLGSITKKTLANSLSQTISPPIMLHKNKRSVPQKLNAKARKLDK